MRYGDSEQEDKDDISDEQTELALSLSQQNFSGQGGNPRDEVDSLVGANYIAVHHKATVASGCEVVIRDKRVEPDDDDDDKAKHGKADPDFRWWNLLEEPNPWQTQKQMVYEIVQQLSVHGMSLVWNVKNGWGKTKWRMVLPRSLVTPFGPGRRSDMPYGGVHVNPNQWNGGYGSILGRVFNSHGWRERDVSFSDITFTAFPHPVLRGDGYSPATAMGRWLDIVARSEGEQINQLGRGSSRRILIPYDGPEQNPTTAQLNACQRKYEARFNNPESNVIVVPPGTDPAQVDIDPETMRYIETGESMNRWILGLQGVSESIIMGDKATYGANAANHQAFSANVIQPLLDLIAAEDSATIKKEEGRAFYVQYYSPKVTDDELDDRRAERDLQKAQFISTLPYVKVNQVLTMLGLPKEEGAGGEKYIGEIEEQTGGGGGAQGGGGRGGFGGGQPPMPPQQPGGSGPMLPPGAQSPEGLDSDEKAVTRYESKTKSMFRESAMVVSDHGEHAPVIAFDLDGTLAHPTPQFVPGLIGEPIDEMIELTRLVRQAGCNVVVYTARNEDSAVAKWLDESGVPWCGINENPYVGPTTGGAKMLFDVLIDDRVTTARTTEGIILKGIVEHLHPEWGAKVVAQMQQSRLSDRSGRLFAPITGKLAAAIRDIQETIDVSHLAGPGLESEPRISILEGMVGGYELDLPRILSQVKRPAFRLQPRTSVISHESHHEARHGQVAVVVELDGEELLSLHSVASRSFAHYSGGGNFAPHITLGYVREEFQGHYFDKPVKRSTGHVGSLVYRHQSSPDLVIPLRD